MSRVYFTATFQHKNLPIPTFSFETNDHTGGGYEIAGLHPTSIAALLGKGPDVKPGERFDLKFNLNKQRTSLSLVVFTTKHLPHVEWSSDGGMGKLPLVGVGALATQLLKGKKNLPGSTSKKTRSTGTAASSSSSSSSSSHTRHRRTGDSKPREKIPPSRQIDDGRRRSTSDKSQRPRDSHRDRRASSSYDSDRPRDAARDDASARRRRRRDDWGYDSGYASDEASSGRGRRSGKPGPRNF